jgi:hypothetical protein
MTPMEDDLKILKGEYLSNHWLDLVNILKLSCGYQTKIDESFIFITSMEDNLKQSKVDFLSNQNLTKLNETSN